MPNQAQTQRQCPQFRGIGWGSALLRRKNCTSSGSSAAYLTCSLQCYCVVCHTSSKTVDFTWQAMVLTYCPFCPNRQDMMAPLEFAKESHQDETSIVGNHDWPQTAINPESSYNKRMNAYKHDTFLRQHVNTFVSYKWMLQALLRRTSGAKGGCQVLAADVILFSEGDPLTWIFTNKYGCIDSRTFVATGNVVLWPRFLKTARRASGVSKDDL